MPGGSKGNQLQVKLRGNILSHPTAAATLILRGCMVNLKATGFLALAGDLASERFAGIAEEGVTIAQAVANGTKNVRVRRRGIFKMKMSAAVAAPTLVGSLVYVHTPQSASVDELVGLTGAVSNHCFVGIIVKHGTDAQAVLGTSTADVWVDIKGADHSVLGDATYNTKTSLAAHTVGAGAELVGVEDAKGWGTSQSVQDALEALLAFGHVSIPFGAFTEADGTALLKQTGDVVGFAILSSKETTILYPDSEGAAALAFGIPVPQDFDESAGFTVHFLVEKDANDDAVTFDLTAFMAGVAQSNLADINDTTIETLAGAVATIEELIFTCGADVTNLIAPPCSLNGIISIIAATTDNTHIHAAWIEYTRKIA